MRSWALLAPARDPLHRTPWRANWREWGHAISGAALKAVSGGAARRDIGTLEVDMLDLDALDTALPAAALSTSTSAAAVAPASAAASMRDVVDASQPEAIRQALSHHQDNWAASSRQLDMDASNLHKLARRLGVKV